jgi:hypothetical protein
MPALSPRRSRGYNSGGVQSPGISIANRGPRAWGKLERYVQDVVSSFANDERVLP